MLHENMAQGTKVIFIGQANVGKTSILKCIMHADIEVTPTIGVTYHRKKLLHDKHIVNLDIWDTSGQERYASINSIYYRGTQISILVFDLSDRDSFKALDSFKTACDNANINIPPKYILLGNKCDLEPAVLRADITSWCERNNIHTYITTSTLSSQGISDVLAVMTDIAMLDVPQPKDVGVVDITPTAQTSNYCIC